MPKRSLRERRERLELSQARIAEKANLKASDVSIAETGKDNAGWRTRRLRRALIAEELLQRKLRHETSRIDRQRAVWNDIPDCPGKERLIELMGDVVWRLLDGAQVEEADLILEMMPEPIATKLLDDFFDPPEHEDAA